MTPRPRLPRRPLHVGGLLLLTAALGTAAAPSAQAMVDPTQPGADLPAEAPAPQARVLTTTPVSYLGTPDEPVEFGTGKLQVSVAPEPTDDAATDDAPTDAAPRDVMGELVDDAPDMGGAVVTVTVTAVEEGSDAEDHHQVGDSATCTTAADGSCDFVGDDELVSAGGDLWLDAGMTFTVQQTGAPTSGLYALPPTGDDVLYGEVADSEALALAPRTSQSNGRGTATLQFLDPLRTVSPADPGTAAPGSSASGTPAAAATTDPAAAASGTAGTAAAAATATAGPALATTGADVGPLAAVGGGLLVAGAAGLVLARRRTAR